jgi:hypothetical protein
VHPLVLFEVCYALFIALTPRLVAFAFGAALEISRI